MKRFKQAWRAFKTSWDGSGDKNIVTINLHYNSDKVSPENANCQRTVPHKLYDIHIGPKIPFPIDATIAHEIGHVISHLAGNSFSADYSLVRLGITTLPVLKEEARAWRIARKILPSITNALISETYGRYFEQFKKD